jgi:hypothetical protein
MKKALFNKANRERMLNTRETALLRSRNTLQPYPAEYRSTASGFSGKAQ